MADTMLTDAANTMEALLNDNVRLRGQVDTLQDVIAEQGREMERLRQQLAESTRVGDELALTLTKVRNEREAKHNEMMHYWSDAREQSARCADYLKELKAARAEVARFRNAPSPADSHSHAWEYAARKARLDALREMRHILSHKGVSAALDFAIDECQRLDPPEDDDASPSPNPVR